jgi:hypothetical protein
MTVYNLTIGGNTKRSTLGQHPVEINWDQVPEEARQFVIKYGLKQYLADGIAGAENVQAAKEGVAERVRKILEADFQRTRGEGGAKPDTVEGLALKLAKDAVRAKAKERKVKLEKEQVEAAAKAWVDRDPKFLEMAQEELNRKAGLMDSFDLDEFLSFGDEDKSEEGGEDE